MKKGEKNERIISVEVKMKNAEKKEGIISVMVEDLIEEQEKEIKRRKWGRWRFSPKQKLLTIRKSRRPGEPERDLYEVYLGRCNTSAGILDWLGQLNQKNWMTPEDLGYLVKALDDVLDLQGNFCSGGEEQSDGKPGYAERLIEKKYLKK